MTWEEVCADPHLHVLPYKIELNRWGNIEMSPAKSYHFEFQFEIGHLLKALLPDGMAVTECAIETSENTKVADVAWVSQERRREIRREVSYAAAPEICVETQSMNDGPAEMRNKRRLYFEAGAVEFCCATRRAGCPSFRRPVRYHVRPSARSFRPGWRSRTDPTFVRSPFPPPRQLPAASSSATAGKPALPSALNPGSWRDRGYGGE